MPWPARAPLTKNRRPRPRPWVCSRLLLLAALGRLDLLGELLHRQDVLFGPLGGLNRLDLERPVVLEAGRGRDQLADDDVLLQADQAVALALEGGVREHLGRLLEGGRRQEGLGGELD